MFKKILSVALLVSSLTACTEDYKDWAKPAVTDQPEKTESVVLTIQPTQAAWDLVEVADDYIQLFTTNAGQYNVPFVVTCAAAEKTYEFNADSKGMVSVEDLNNAVLSLYGEEVAARDLKFTVAATLPVMVGESKTFVSVKSSSADIKVSPLVAVRPAELDEEETNIYMTGANYGWGATWVSLHPVNGNADLAWILVWIDKDEEFKFSPVAKWEGDFSPTVENDYAESGITTPGNCKGGKAGWYILKVNKSTKTMDVYKPEVYLIGDVAEAGWGVDPSGLFEVPANKEGKFVSPAFKKDADVRMCVNIGEDWWKTEFVGLKYDKFYWITYRGNGGDQTRVGVKAGQKAYVRFSDGFCQYK